MNKNYYIIDFDSTFIKTEALEQLAQISLKNNPNNEAIIKCLFLLRLKKFLVLEFFREK